MHTINRPNPEVLAVNQPDPTQEAVMAGAWMIKIKMAKTWRTGNSSGIVAMGCQLGQSGTEVLNGSGSPSSECCGVVAIEN